MNVGISYRSPAESGTTNERVCSEEQPHSSLSSVSFARGCTVSLSRRLLSSGGIWGIPLRWRRGLILLATIGMTVLTGGLLAPAFYWGKADWLVALGSALLTGLCLFGHFSWLLWMMGFVGWKSRPPEDDTPEERITTRTALVMPIYHEDAGRVAAGIRHTWLSARKAGLAAHCDCFVLSDSADADVQRLEEEAVRGLLSLFDGNQRQSGRLFLVRRADRLNYKAGNIANFLRHYGRAYDFMLVLDADSVMLGRRIRQLILRMQRQPHTAILQSLMSVYRGTTPFGQLMQFSVSRLAAIFSCGFAWFLGPEALYWGHNALIRIKPFMEHAQLPIFPGKPPFGGRILSQDVHEASLLGRAGWDVELDLNPGGSFEELPSNVISYSQRDQRWCTGDFLNSALILGDGFKTGQRVWLGYAMLSYSMSLVLVALMLIGFALSARQAASSIDARALWWALIYIPVMQLGSKFLLFWLHLDRRLSWWRQGVSLFCDIVGGLLMTPLLVYQHATFVLGILLGKAVQWTSPSRNPNDGLSWRFAVRVFWAPTLLAAVWIPLAGWLAPAFLFFSGTILVPWLFSIPLAVWGTDARLGAWLARHGIFASRRENWELEELGSLVDGTSDAWWAQKVTAPRVSSTQMPREGLWRQARFRQAVLRSFSFLQLRQRADQRKSLGANSTR
jgi:membrane glycosyltransferase